MSLLDDLNKTYRQPSQASSGSLLADLKASGVKPAMTPDGSNNSTPSSSRPFGGNRKRSPNQQARDMATAQDNSVNQSQPWNQPGVSDTNSGITITNPGGRKPFSGSVGASVVQSADTFHGRPYQWGGTGQNGKGIDCSALVQNAWKAQGVNLPRVAADQFRATKAVNESDLQPGDMIFMKGTTDKPGITHVIMYAGNGRTIGASSKHGVVYGSLNDPYVQAHLADKAFRRPNGVAANRYQQEQQMASTNQDEPIWKKAVDFARGVAGSGAAGAIPFLINNAIPSSEQPTPSTEAGLGAGQGAFEGLSNAAKSVGKTAAGFAAFPMQAAETAGSFILPKVIGDGGYKAITSLQKMARQAVYNHLPASIREQVKGYIEPALKPMTAKQVAMMPVDMVKGTYQGIATVPQQLQSGDISPFLNSLAMLAMFGEGAVKGKGFIEGLGKAGVERATAAGIDYSNQPDVSAEFARRMNNIKSGDRVGTPAGEGIVKQMTKTKTVVDVEGKTVIVPNEQVKPVDIAPQTLNMVAPDVTPQVPVESPTNGLTPEPVNVPAKGGEVAQGDAGAQVKQPHEMTPGEYIDKALSEGKTPYEGWRNDYPALSTKYPQTPVEPAKAAVPQAEAVGGDAGNALPVADFTARSGSQLVYHTRTKGDFPEGYPTTNIGSDSDIFGKGLYFGTKARADTYGKSEPLILDGKFASTEQWVNALKEYSLEPIESGRSAARELLQSQGYDGIKGKDTGVVWNDNAITRQPPAIEPAPPVKESVTTQPAEPVAKPATTQAQPSVAKGVTVGANADTVDTSLTLKRLRSLGSKLEIVQDTPAAEVRSKFLESYKKDGYHDGTPDHNWKETMDEYLDYLRCKEL